MLLNSNKGYIRSHHTTQNISWKEKKLSALGKKLVNNLTEVKMFWFLSLKSHNKDEMGKGHHTNA